MKSPETVRALTLHQPYASLIAAGAKRYETRGWPTDYRGPVAIHAAARPVSIDDLRFPGIESALRGHGILPADIPLERAAEYLPLGQVLCIADLVECHETEFMLFPGEFEQTEEYSLGNYDPGRYAFELDIRQVFQPGIPAKGQQGWWTFTLPDSHPQQEPMMPKNPETNKKAGRPRKPSTEMEVHSEVPGPEVSHPFLDESEVAGEKNAIDGAFSTPAQERPGAPTNPDFDKDRSAPAPEAVTRLPAVKEYAPAVSHEEFLPTFQKVVFVEFTDHEFAEQAKAMAAADIEIKEMEAEMANEVKEWKDKIKGVEARRIALSTQVSQGGAEKEITCNRRIDEATQTLTIFNADTLEIVETRKLNSSEMQTELGLINTQRAAAATGGKRPRGARVVQGNFPEHKMIGAGEPENAEQEAQNEAAVAALAEESGE